MGNNNKEFYFINKDFQIICDWLIIIEKKKWWDEERRIKNIDFFLQFHILYKVVFSTKNK